jgi:UDP:flavonoid glycosyltransferase YjiC (YdhE family)
MEKALRQPVQAHGGADKPLKIVIFPLCWVLAHVGRTLEIAKVLRARGHEVVFAGENPDHPLSRLDHARKHGFRTVKVKEPNWPWAWDRFQRLGGMVALHDLIRHQDWAPLEVIMEDIIRVASEEKPDLIIGDASLGVSPAGHVLGIPAAGVFNAYNVKFYRPWRPLRFLIDLMDKTYWGPIRNRVYRRHGVEPISGYDLWHKTLMLSPDLPELFAPLPEFPNWHAVGPLVSEPPCALPEWYGELADGQPNVYITMGSTGFLEPLLDRVYDELSKSRYRFIVTTGNQVSEACMQRAPRNFRFASYAPGSRLLEHSSAMVFHGGNGTMYQALAAGVPMLALPSHEEQKISTSKAIEEGFGIKGNVRKITGRQLLANIDRLVDDPSYRNNAWRFRRAVRNANAAEHAAGLLEAHVRQHQQARAAQ